MSHDSSNYFSLPSKIALGSAKSPNNPASLTNLDLAFLVFFFLHQLLAAKNSRQHHDTLLFFFIHRFFASPFDFCLPFFADRAPVFYCCSHDLHEPRGLFFLDLTTTPSQHSIPTSISACSTQILIQYPNQQHHELESASRATRLYFTQEGEESSRSCFDRGDVGSVTSLSVCSLSYSYAILDPLLVCLRQLEGTTREDPIIWGIFYLGLIYHFTTTRFGETLDCLHAEILLKLSGILVRRLVRCLVISVGFKLPGSVALVSAHCKSLMIQRFLFPSPPCCPIRPWKK